MVQTEFSVVRFRGDQATADKVYEGIQPLTAEDISEEIVWAASRPPHVNLAEVFVLPVNQASATCKHSGKHSIFPHDLSIGSELPGPQVIMHVSRTKYKVHVSANCTPHACNLLIAKKKLHKRLDEN